MFKKTLGPAERSLVSELRDIRNRHAHQKTFSGDDTYRALDSTERLLNAITAAEQAEAVRQMKDELMRLRYEEQLRGEKRKEAAAAVVGRPADGLPGETSSRRTPMSRAVNTLALNLPLIYGRSSRVRASMSTFIRWNFIGELTSLKV